MSSLTQHRSGVTQRRAARPRHRAESATTRQEQGLARELRASAVLLGLSFGLTAVVVVSAQAAAALLGS